uniref:DDE Tnp4 domain-containing protein n=1 Tax=Sander lucioperca TaxID=283035 RepID=A0A8C9XSS4_SANLU
MCENALKSPPNICLCARFTSLTRSQHRITRTQRCSRLREATEKRRRPRTPHTVCCTQGLRYLDLKHLCLACNILPPKSSTLPAEDQILLILMKLRQNFVIVDLAKRFKMSPGQVSKTLKFWIDVIAEHTQDLIPWLPRETRKATLLKAFKDSFPNTTCIIDCTESVLQKAKNLDSRTESYSHYYAKAYGGKCSDRFITQNSGFLDHLRAGDEVTGDRGFTIRDLLEERNVGLITPQVTRTRRIANVRIHIERAIRRLKVYKILSQTVPIHSVTKIDKILKICAALVNLRGELISSK